MRVVITGASRGIGLEMVRQYLGRGDVVEASARHPHRATELQKLAHDHPRTLRTHTLDVSDGESIGRFAGSLEDGAIDLLVNNAGIGGKSRAFESLDFEDVVQVFRVNALGPLRVTAALLGFLKRSKAPKVVHISSMMGSISDNGSGGYYAYRMSKAALNMASRSLARDLKSAGVATAVFNPGWVKTDMGGAGAPTPVEESVRGLVHEFDRLSMRDSGEFIDHRGRKVPW